MADFQVKLSDTELLQVIGDYVRDKYNVKDMLTIAWNGGTPMGVTVTAQPIVLKKNLSTSGNIFEE